MKTKSATKEVSEDVQKSTEVMEAVKHPLEDAWTIWLQTCDRNKWGDLVDLTSFDTVEDYWWYYPDVFTSIISKLASVYELMSKHPEWVRKYSGKIPIYLTRIPLYHHMKFPSELEKGQDYAIFKKGITPTWDDVANNNGGRWIINVDNKRKSDLDSKWALTVLTLIGATLDRKDAVCGAVVNVRNNKNKIGIWLTDARNKEAILSVGKQMKDLLEIRGKLNFHQHRVPVNKYFI